jgi:hypothetical protein
MIDKRERLRTSPIGENISFSKYIGMVFEEPLILHHFAQKHQFYHWIEHLNSFERFLTEPVPNYSMKENFDAVKKLIISGLSDAGFTYQAYQLAAACDEDELNNCIIKQYTEETPLYYQVNAELRNCHLLQNEPITSDLEKYHNDLAPWILQLNTAIRKRPSFEGKCFRGTRIDEDVLKLYKEKELFVWAPFVSASKCKEQCFGGNVLFEIFTESAMSLNDKRFPRDISGLSAFFEEQEVLLPIACAYRVHYIKEEGGLTIMGIATVDYN